LNLFGQGKALKGELDTSFHIGKKVNGRIYDHFIKSDCLKEERKITIYEPPNFDPKREYGVFYILDGDAVNFAGDLETLIETGKIAPVIMVGIHLREALQIDSLNSVSKTQFRNFEYIKSAPAFDSIYKKPNLNPILSNRYGRYCSFLKEEVTDYLKANYQLKKNKKYWTIGGYSNGGSFVLSFSAANPNMFGNAIAMSPGFNDKTNGFVFPYSSDVNYYLCAGTKEPNFLSTSLDVLPRFKNKKIKYIHKTFDTGHDWRMWYSFYKFSITEIYK
jgi:enterochelin esterase-like enzyme